MREYLIRLDRELERWGLNRVAPFLRDLRFELSIKRGVDLTGVEIAGQVGQLRRRPAHITLYKAWIDDSFPVRVRIPGCADEHLRFGGRRSHHECSMQNIWPGQKTMRALAI